MLINALSRIQQQCLKWAFGSIQSNHNPHGTCIGLTAIPPELLIEILKYCDYRSILSVRQTCRVAENITRTRAIWNSLFWQYVRKNPPKTFALEKPISAYSSEAIEQVVLAFESSRIGWRTDDGVPSRQREIVTKGSVQCGYLVPGGRWMLGVFTNGRIGYFDLESQGQVEEKELVPPQMLKSRYNIFKISVDVADTLPMTSFNLAVYMRERLRYRKTYNGIKIWKIEFVFDGQDVVGLKATYLKSILMDPEAISLVHSISLLDRHIAFSVEGRYEQPDATFVVEWPDIEDGSLNFPRKHIRWIVRTTELHLLPGQRIVSAYQYILRLTDYSTVQVTTSAADRPDPPAEAVNLWQGNLESYIGLSLPFISQDQIRVLALSQKVLYEITIDNLAQPTSPDQLTVKRLISIPSANILLYKPGTDHVAHGLGHDRGVLYLLNRSPNIVHINLLEYQPGVENPDFIPIVKTTKHLDTMHRQPHFDSGSGRLVACFVGRLLAMDFALIYKNSEF